MASRRLCWPGSRISSVISSNRTWIRRLSKDTLYDYLHHLEESLFLITITNRANPSAARKIYLVDNGLYQVIRTRPDRGQLWENACFLELHRRGKKLDFWLDDKGEIDFVTDSELIQVCLSQVCPSRNERDEEREKSSLLRVMNIIPEKEAVIWTREQSGEGKPETGITRLYGLCGAGNP